MELYRSEPKQKRKKKASKSLKPVKLGIGLAILVAGLVYLLTQVNFSSHKPSSPTTFAANKLPLKYEGSMHWKGPNGNEIKDCVVKLNLDNVQKNEQQITFSFNATISSLEKAIAGQGTLNMATQVIDLPKFGKGKIEVISEEHLNIKFNKNGVLHNTH